MMSKMAMAGALIARASDTKGITKMIRDKEEE
jgi:hypothetical protein